MFPLRRLHWLIGALIFLTLLTNAFVAFWNISRLVRNEELVESTYETKSQIEQIVSFTKDIETGQRGFILTADESYLDPFRRAQMQISPALKGLEILTSDPQQRTTLPLLRRSVDAHLATAKQAIQLRRTQGGRAAIRFVRQGKDKRQMDDIRILADKMKGRADELLTLHTGESDASAQDAFRTFWIATGANVLFLGLIAWLFIRTMRQNNRLQRTVRDLKRSEDLRESLTEMMVHDLRTPLTTLLGPLELLEEEVAGPLGQSQKEIIGMSVTSGGRLLNMVNGILDISKLEAGELRLSCTTFNVLTVIQTACHQAKHFTDTTTAPVATEVPDGLRIYADHDIIERILINLLSNALKFTPPTGNIKVRVGQADGHLLVEVEDSGEGIPTEDFERIFDKFGQVESRKGGHNMSTGLGLTFCKLAVEAHGGSIGVRSELGSGSTFWFEIPLLSESRTLEWEAHSSVHDWTI
ncbi:hypothetical protein EON83_19835 [bacterium]|nr:MAG: hypothetical protein EON83_19835 [bacterium]